MGQSIELDSHAMVRVLLMLHLSFADSGLILLTSLEVECHFSVLGRGKAGGDPFFSHRIAFTLEIPFYALQEKKLKGFYCFTFLKLKHLDNY